MIKTFELKHPISEEMLSSINDIRYQISLNENSILKKRETELPDILINEENFLFVAQDEIGCCGYLTLSLSQHEAQPTKEVFELQVFVHPRRPRQGIGKALVKKSIDFAEENINILTLTGWVKKMNPASKQLLESHGFTVVRGEIIGNYWVLNRKTHNKMLKDIRFTH